MYVDSALIVVSGMATRREVKISCLGLRGRRGL